MITGIIFNILFVLAVTRFHFRSEIAEAREARKVPKPNEKLLTKLDRLTPKKQTYVNKRGNRVGTKHIDGSWEWDKYYYRPERTLRIGSNPPKPAPPQNRMYK